MKKYVLVVLFIILITISGLLIANKNDIAGDNLNKSKKKNNLVSNNGPKTFALGESTNTNKIEIQNLTFNPSILTIQKGQTVTWLNNDSHPHSITSNTSYGPNSSSIQPGETYSFTFVKEGTFYFRSNIQMNAQGTIIVAK